MSFISDRSQLQQQQENDETNEEDEVIQMAAAPLSGRSAASACTKNPNTPSPSRRNPVCRTASSAEQQQQVSSSPMCMDDNANHNNNNAATNNPQQSSSSIEFSIVWSPLPPITWFIPIIGHVGITDSNGIASDFRGPYFVGDDGRMAFGPPTRALRILVVPADEVEAEEQRALWDQGVQMANNEYSHRMHNIFCDNCHSHVAYALNHMKMMNNYSPHDGISQWNMVKIALLVFIRGRFLSISGFLHQFVPFGIFVCLILYFKLR